MVMLTELYKPATRLKSETGTVIWNDLIIWFHDGVHGTKGYVSPDGNFEAVISAKTPNGEQFSIGLRSKTKGASEGQVKP